MTSHVALEGGLMARTIRALLVGIDEYQPPVQALHGCVNDIEAFARLLRKRAAASGDHVNIRMLLNADASRAAVISAFREHLGAAEPGQSPHFFTTADTARRSPRCLSIMNWSQITSTRRWYCMTAVAPAAMTSPTRNLPSL